MAELVPECVVVMPVYNEAGCIEAVCREWLDVLGALPSARLLVVNDGSTDATAQILGVLQERYTALTVLTQPNGGHGAAIRTGYEAALATATPWIFQADSDGQIPARDFLKLWALRDQSQACFGIRSNRQDPAHRRVLSYFHRILLNTLFHVRLADPNVPFRLVESRTLADCLGRIPRGVFAPNVFLSILAARGSAGILQVPIEHRERQTGEASIRLLRIGSLVWRCFRELIQFHRQVRKTSDTGR